jgi:hypothetical protein
MCLMISRGVDRSSKTKLKRDKGWIWAMDGAWRVWLDADRVRSVRDYRGIGSQLPAYFLGQWPGDKSTRQRGKAMLLYWPRVTRSYFRDPTFWAAYRWAAMWVVH